MHARKSSRPSTALGHSGRFKPEPLVLSVVRNRDATLLDLRSQRYFTLNEVGTRIWVLLSKGTEHAVIAELLAEEYDAPFDVIASDTSAIVDALVKARLVRPLDEDGSPAGRTTRRLRIPWLGGSWRISVRGGRHGRA
ncbi:MAG TPA: PqqD family protein [Gemmatimonadaceae bacterium]|nr:PqqD family protein [Gemmatimonadaceae bacterium]